VLLVIKATNSSSMAQCQFGSARVAWTEEGTGGKVDVEVADRVSMSTESQKLHFACCNTPGVTVESIVALQCFLL
jgi:hypothetical protein